MKYLIKLINKNDIEIEIIKYFEEHPKIKEYCIDDNHYFFELIKEHMVKLLHQLSGGKGLKEIDKNIIVKILKNDNINMLNYVNNSILNSTYEVI